MKKHGTLKTTAQHGAEAGRERKLSRAVEVYDLFEQIREFVDPYDHPGLLDELRDEAVLQVIRGETAYD